MCHTPYSLAICFAPSLADSIIFLTLTRLVVVIILENFSFALFTPPSRRLSIIQFLPIDLAEGARAWLEHLLARTVRDWLDLRKAFVGNIQGTYKRPKRS
jgi:hypothetical protein